MVPVEEQLYLELIEKIKTYHPSDDFSMIEKAYQLANGAHKDQKRKSGEPYIIHPLKVAYILAELELDMESIVAGILHDIIEDTEYSYEDISNMFSEEIAALVDGVTKLGKLSYIIPDIFIISVKNMRTVFMYIYSVYILTINISTNMIAFLNNKNVFTPIFSFVR